MYTRQTPHCPAPQPKRLRAEIRAMNTHEMSRGYRDFYAKLYPNVVQLAEPEIADDESSNVVRVVEKY